MSDLFKRIDGEIYFTVQWVHEALGIPKSEGGSGFGHKYIRTFLQTNPEYYGAHKHNERWLIHPEKLHLIVKKARESWDNERRDL